MESMYPAARGRISTISTASRWPGYSSQLVTVVSCGCLTVTLGVGRATGLGGEQAVSTAAQSIGSRRVSVGFIGNRCVIGNQLIAIRETVSSRSLCTFPIAFGSSVEPYQKLLRNSTTKPSCQVELNNPRNGTQLKARAPF